MRINLILSSVVAIFIVGCTGIKVESEQARDFEQIQLAWRSYRWQEPPLEDTDGRLEGLLVVDRTVRAHADRLLAGLGYRVVAQGAQFEISYRLGDEAVVGLPALLSPRDMSERILAGPNAEYEVSSRFYTHRNLAYHEISHLQLSFFDIGTNRIVWASRASRVVDDPQAGPEKVSREIGRTVDKMLRKFPHQFPR